MDLADKYPPAEAFDDEPTVRVNLRPIHAQVVIEDDEPTLPSQRSPVFPKEEKKYPGVGLLLAFGTGFLFWGAVAWLVVGYYHYHSHTNNLPEAGVEAPR